MMPLRYEQKHYAYVVEWYLARKLTPPPVEQVPQVGLIIPEIAAGFLVQTDNHFALFWGLISNPRMPKSFRQIALTAITTGIADLARQEGYQHILGLTAQPSVRAYAANQNYQESAVTLVLKELT